ncbi:MAG: hypothetical protein V7754_07260 [Halioglobus sp.]
MKKIQSKAEIRALLEQEMDSYMQDGGKVDEIPRGISGRDAQDTGALNTRSLFLEPSSKRTHVPEVIAAIEARRKAKLVHKPAAKPLRKNKRRQKTIYDDFGEALRTVWVEE